MFSTGSLGLEVFKRMTVAEFRQRQQFPLRSDQRRHVAATTRKRIKAYRAQIRRDRRGLEIRLPQF